MSNPMRLQLTDNDLNQSKREEALYNALTAYSKCIESLANNTRLNGFLNYVPAPQGFISNFTRFQEIAAREQKEAQAKAKAVQEEARDKLGEVIEPEVITKS